MCGIVGLVASAGSSAKAAERLLVMRDTMVTRGPDDAGVLAVANGAVHLGHRRLSIIELSDLGHQPMVSPDGRLSIVYNGEIYNHLELRPDLERLGWHFRSGSDTETILAAYRIYGNEAFARLRGMYALAIWDEDRSCLVLARDPHGIKPLYFRTAPTFAFASQVRALLADPETERTLDPAAIAGFSIWGSVPEPRTLVAGVSALPAGHFMEVDSSGRAGKPVPFQTIDAIFRASGDQSPVDHRDVLRDSVRRHMLADTEVGCFLSAGVDSGAILGMMRDTTDERLRAFTLRFSEFVGTPQDESVLASQVARLYNADHRVETIDAKDFAASLPGILDSMDQPSIDGVNSWFVSRSAARAGLRVALSGLGGDELLGGYSTFRTVPATWRLAKAMRRTGPVGAAAQAFLHKFGKGKLRHALDLGSDLAGAYVLRRAMALPVDCQDPAIGAALENVRHHAGSDTDGDLYRVSLLESSLYMRNQLLRDSDWAGMAHSLEIRLPLVDAEVSRQLAARIADFADGRGKHILATSPSKPLPSAIVDRKKTGFGVPVSTWLGGDSKTSLSRDWAGRVLDSYVERHRLNF